MISVMLISKQEQVLRTLRRFLSADSDLEIAAEAPGGEAALEKIENSSPDILLINAGGTDTDAINLAERIILRKPRTFVILLLQEMSVENLQNAIAAGCHNVIEFPLDERDLCDYVRRVYNAENNRITALDSNERVTWSSKVITVFGGKGGLGKTTISVNLAVSLARKQKKVAIVDLDLQFGDVHLFMDIEPKETIADLMQDIYELNADSIRSFMSIHPSGVHVLSAPKSPEYAEMISAERIQNLLSLLRSCYDYVIIDTSAAFSDPILAALEASSMILLVTGLDVCSLKNSKIVMSVLETLGLKKKVRAVINRAVEGSTISMDDVQHIIDAPILFRIPSDYQLAVAAVNQGQPFVESRPKAALSQALNDIAEKLLNGEEDFDMQRLSRRERKALIKRYKTKERKEKKR